MCTEIDFTTPHTISTMKLCAACHTDLPKANFSKKQWKIDDSQRRCKVCVADNRELQVQQSTKNNNEPDINNNNNNASVVSLLETMNITDDDLIVPVTDEELFKQPPPKEDCPICFLSIPTLATGQKYMACCGQIICSGCTHAPVYDDQGNEIQNGCPFCRKPSPISYEESLKRCKNRVKLGDSEALTSLGAFYNNGDYGLRQDSVKAVGLWRRGAKLGNHQCFHNIGHAYVNGVGVEHSMEKAEQYWELAAIKGDVLSRHNLGICEERRGNYARSIKHHLIATRLGDKESLDKVQSYFMMEIASKDDYQKALSNYQKYLGEIKSTQRDEAALSYERNRYY